MKVTATLVGPAADMAMAAMADGTTRCPRCGNLVRVEKPDEHFHLVPHPKSATWDGTNVSSVVTHDCEGSGEKVTPRPALEAIAMSFDVPDDSDLAEVERELNKGVVPELAGNHWVITRELMQ